MAFIPALINPCRVFAWDNHAEITFASLQAYEGLEEASYEPVEEVLPFLRVNHPRPPQRLGEFCEQLKIHCSKVRWDWMPSDQERSALSIIAFSDVEADAGMDQNLDLSPDQKYMGGYSGLSSQGYRHMYYQRWDLDYFFESFHFPLVEMGEAPWRAQLFLKLALQAKFSGHLFWAYRFLGFGLHYLQDLGQPYHSTQFASFSLLPIKTLMSSGWNGFVAETSRRVSNFHLSFEEYTKVVMAWNNNGRGDSDLLIAFKVPRVDQEFKISLEQNTSLSIVDGVKLLAKQSSRLASKIVHAQYQLMGSNLLKPEVEFKEGMVDFSALESNHELREYRKKLNEQLFIALSNTGLATRWYIDQFKLAKEKP